MNEDEERYDPELRKEARYASKRQKGVGRGGQESEAPRGGFGFAISAKDQKNGNKQSTIVDSSVMAYQKTSDERGTHPVFKSAARDQAKDHSSHDDSKDDFGEETVRYRLQDAADIRQQILFVDG